MLLVITKNILIFVGYHNWGHPDHESKRPRITQTLGPSPLQVREVQVTLGPRPSATVRPFRGLASRGANSASLEGSPPRPLGAKAISASLETPLAEPSAGPPRGGKLHLARDHPRQTVAATQPPDGTGRIYSPTTPRHGAGVRWSQAASTGVGHHAAQQT